jgi:hypothetical protein
VQLQGKKYSCKVDKVFAGVRAILPGDEMHRILLLGHVDLHSCQRIGLPDPNFSRFKVAFKAHVFNGHAGSAGHLVYLRQQMTKVAPVTTEVMEDMCERMFGGHELDMDERGEWRRRYDHPSPVDTKLREVASAWLSRGATRATLEAARLEALGAGARLAFTDGRGIAQQKRKQPQGSDRGWQGQHAQGANATWAELAATAGSPTHYASWSYTRGQHTDLPGAGEGRVLPQGVSWGAHDDAHTAASSSSGHNAWATQQPVAHSDLPGEWAGGEAQQEFAWGTYADAHTAASSSSGHTAWATQPPGGVSAAPSQPSTAWGTPGWDGIAYPRQTFQPWYQ